MKLGMAKPTGTYGVGQHGTVLAQYGTGSARQPPEIACSIEQPQPDTMELSPVSLEMHLSAAQHILPRFQPNVPYMSTCTDVPQATALYHPDQ